MALTKDKLKKNAMTFFEKVEEYGVYTPELTEFLGAAIGDAPASTMTSLHNAFQGGLIDHILKVTKYAFNINEMLPKNLKQDKTSIIKVAFIHQIGKVFLYNENPSQWHRDNQGKMYEFNEELVSMRVGERSAYYAMDKGVSLTEAEFQAIINYDKSEEDKQAKWHSEPLGVILKQANELAIMEEKANEKK